MLTEEETSSSQCYYHLFFYRIHFDKLLPYPQFRIGFKHVFRWCPFIRAGEYEGLEMKSTRYLQTQSSMYKISRIETTVSSVLSANDEEAEENGKSSKRLSLDLTSNGSSRSVCKTMSDSSSFYSNNLS
ncbi:hypothetical protein GDO81_009333 [Engystomops pustulosus]|uniref:Uncharacterized protein n=1 Tax=Engystomops pustulosus TaxID=76066 RepID=A0AAV7BQQ2_ENGPU|nr:hypothetical protein GDO81_009333 [Engystomops pustulosus]